MNLSRVMLIGDINVVTSHLLIYERL